MPRRYNRSRSHDRCRAFKDDPSDRDSFCLQTDPVTSTISRFARSPREVLGVAAVLLVAVLLGAFTGRSPGLGIALAAALVFGLIVFSDLAVGVCLFLLVTFLDAVSQNQNLSLTKGAGAVLAGSWLAMLATRRGARGGGLTAQAPWLVAAVAGFLAWSAMSAFWSESRAAADTSTFRYGLDALLIPITFWAIRDRKQVVWIFGVFVVGTLLSVAWGITHGKTAGGVAAAQVGRLSGANLEANVLAALLIVCALFASALAVVQKRRPLGRGLAVLAACLALIALFGTFSRGGFVALGVVMLAGCVYAGKSRPAFIALVVGVVLVGAVFLHNTTSTGVQRLTSTSTSGRADLWKIGLRMVKANPVLGVGSGNYTVAEPHYLLVSAGEIQAVAFIIGDPYPAHNMYLQVQVELGVVGLALFLGIIFLSVGAAAKAVKLFSARGDRSMEVLGRTLVLAIVAFLTADFFLSDQYDKQLWLLLAMGPVLLAIAQRSASAAGEGPPAPSPRPELLPLDPARRG